jgi:SAM-dependent methyltransferase
MERAEDYVRTGRPLEIHKVLAGERWGVYQRGMRALAGAAAAETVRRLPVPHGATRMLDIGGSHGYYSVVFCRRYKNLRSVVLDLPQAIEYAAPLLASEGMGDRVVHQRGNALTEDFGSEVYDVVFTAQLVHHLSQEENRQLAIRVARALRPGGVYAILDEFRPRTAKGAGQLGAIGLAALGVNENVAAWLGMMVVGAIVGLVGWMMLTKAKKVFQAENFDLPETVGSLKDDGRWVKHQLQQARQ